jgi:3-phosphoshikimate 1-carboxyvinyltransferase
MLKNFSYPIKHEGNTLVINSTSECLATEIFVPGDISSAAFFIVAATIIPGSDILIHQVGINSTRTGIIHILLEMGAQITLLNQRQLGEEWVADLRVQYAPLKGIHIPQEQVPLAIDEFPIIFIAAACAKGQTTLRGAKELRVKESDRIASMVEGLRILGICAEALEDGVSIEGGRLQGGTVESKGDHRIAMSFAIAGAVACDPVIIKECAHVATSFPLFVETAKKLQLQIEEQVDYV